MFKYGGKRTETEDGALTEKNYIYLNKRKIDKTEVNGVVVDRQILNNVTVHTDYYNSETKKVGLAKKLLKQALASEVFVVLSPSQVKERVTGRNYQTLSSNTNYRININDDDEEDYLEEDFEEEDIEIESDDISDEGEDEAWPEMREPLINPETLANKLLLIICGGIVIAIVLAIILSGLRKREKNL